MAVVKEMSFQNGWSGIFGEMKSGGSKAHFPDCTASVTHDHVM